MIRSNTAGAIPPLTRCFSNSISKRSQFPKRRWHRSLRVNHDGPFRTTTGFAPSSAHVHSRHYHWRVGTTEPGPTDIADGLPRRAPGSQLESESFPGGTNAIGTGQGLRVPADRDSHERGISAKGT